MLKNREKRKQTSRDRFATTNIDRLSLLTQTLQSQATYHTHNLWHPPLHVMTIKLGLEDISAM